MTLRRRLRTDLRPHHDSLDRQLSVFDLTDAHDFAAFLLVQVRSLDAISRVGQSPDTCAAMDDLVARARSDLRSLDAAAPYASPVASVHADALAVDYIIGGSQLGNAVLGKQWGQGSVPRVRAASGFFSGPDHRDVWQRFLKQAEAHDGTGPYADKVVEDAAALFQVFCVNAEDVMTTYVKAHA